MATYYVRVDGSAANLAAATGPGSSAAACMDPTLFGASAFAAGDTVVFSDQGGNYTSSMSLNDDGTEGNPVTIIGGYAHEGDVNGESGNPLITLAGYGFRVLANYVTVKGIDIVNTLESGSMWCLYSTLAGLTGLIIEDCTLTATQYAIYIGGVTNDLTVRGCTITSSESITVASAGESINVTIDDCTISESCTFRDVSSLTITDTTVIDGQILVVDPDSMDLVISDCTLESSSEYSFFCFGTVSVNSISLTNLTCNGLFCINCDDITIDGLFTTILPIQFVACSGGLQAQNISVEGVESNAGGIAFSTSGGFDNGSFLKNTSIINCYAGIEFTTGVTNLLIENVTVQDSTDNNGFRGGAGCNNLTFRRCSAIRNAGDGFSFSGGATPIYGVTLEECSAICNGTVGELAAGDGFTCHDNDYGYILRRCTAIGNTSSGVAMVLQSSGIIEDCYFEGNHHHTYTIRGGIYLSPDAVNPTSGFSWVFRNNQMVNNGTREFSLSDGEGYELSFSGNAMIWPDQSAAIINDNGSLITFAAFQAAREPLARWGRFPDGWKVA